MRFQLRAKDEDAIADVVQKAFQNWSGNSAGEGVEKVRRIEVRGKKITPTSVLEERFTEGFEADRGSALALSVDAIQFEDNDTSWATTTVRQANQTETPENIRTLMVRKHESWYAVLSEAPVEVFPKYDVEPVPLFTPGPPPYPQKARERGVSGEVVVQVAVELDGSTTFLRVVKGLPYCTTAAIENALKWRWRPAVQDGAPIRALGLITIAFDLTIR